MAPRVRRVASVCTGVHPGGGRPARRPQGDDPLGMVRAIGPELHAGRRPS
jgi:hypothetical protein